MRIRAFGARLGRESTAKTEHAVDVCTLLELRRGRPGVPRQYAGTRKTEPRSDEGWEKAFFESEFTHAAIDARLTSHPEGFLGLWRDLAGSEGEFPGEFLVKSGESLHGFVQGRED